MKLLLFILLPAISFAQKDSGLIIPNWIGDVKKVFTTNDPGFGPSYIGTASSIKPDTIPATLLITHSTSRLGIPHAHRGYVVLNDWGQAVKYLDCRKREIKEPGIIWDFKLKK